MKNHSRFRLLTLAGIFAILSFGLSSCFYGGGFGYRSPYYFRPNYGYGFSRPRIYHAPPRNYYHYDYYRRGGRSYGGNIRSYRGRGSSRNGRR